VVYQEGNVLNLERRVIVNLGLERNLDQERRVIVNLNLERRVIVNLEQERNLGQERRVIVGEDLNHK
jgi:hypothetical protein